MALVTLCRRPVCADTETDGKDEDSVVDHTVYLQYKLFACVDECVAVYVFWHKSVCRVWPTFTAESLCGSLERAA